MSLPARKLHSPSGSPWEQALPKRNCPRRNQMTARLSLNHKPPVSRELPSRVSISIRTQTLSGGCGELNSLRVSPSSLFTEKNLRRRFHSSRNHRGHIFFPFLKSSNLSPFANYICQFWE